MQKHIIEKPSQHVSRSLSMQRRKVPAVYGKAAQADAFAALQNFLQKRLLSGELCAHARGVFPGSCNQLLESFPCIRRPVGCGGSLGQLHTSGRQAELLHIKLGNQNLQHCPAHIWFRGNGPERLQIVISRDPAG